MFGFYDRKEQDFLSNPSVDDIPVVKPKIVDGVIRNEVVRVPQPKDLLSGLIYEDDSMSLRAQLNLGVDLMFVPNDSLDNDPAVSLSKIERLSNSITNFHAQLLAEEAACSQISKSE